MNKFYGIDFHPKKSYYLHLDGGNAPSDCSLSFLDKPDYPYLSKFKRKQVLNLILKIFLNFKRIKNSQSAFYFMKLKFT